MACPPQFYVLHKLMRRAKLLELGLRFEEGVQYEDVGYLARALGEMGWLVTVPGPAYHYVSRRSSTVKSRQTARKQAERYRALHDFIAYADRIGVPLQPRYRSITKRFYGCFVDLAAVRLDPGLAFENRIIPVIPSHETLLYLQKLQTSAGRRQQGQVRYRADLVRNGRRQPRIRADDPQEHAL